MQDDRSLPEQGCACCEKSGVAEANGGRILGNSGSRVSRISLNLVSLLKLGHRAARRRFPWRRDGEAALLGQHLIARKMKTRFDGLKRPTF
jgi:hypothetical protein